MKTTKTLAFCFFALVANHLSGQEPLGTIQGTLKENGAPIVDAAVFLQSFDNEQCVKLFMHGNWDENSVTKLRSCMHDVSTTTVDASGNYRFTKLRAGWYAVHLLWNITDKPKRFLRFTKEGNWIVIYAGFKDSSGKYDTMAQDIPFNLREMEVMARDFSGH